MRDMRTSAPYAWQPGGVAGHERNLPWPSTRGDRMENAAPAHERGVHGVIAVRVLFADDVADARAVFLYACPVVPSRAWLQMRRCKGSSSAYVGQRAATMTLRRSRERLAHIVFEFRKNFARDLVMEGRKKVRNSSREPNRKPV